MFIKKTRKTHKNNLACNPDFKLLVALSLPRSGFLAIFSACGSIKEPPGLEF
jgi:hypothetical protein